MLYWMIVYPRGNRNYLDIAQVWSYEQDEWDIANPEQWPNTEDGRQEAYEKMLELSEKHSLKNPKSRKYIY